MNHTELQAMTVQLATMMGWQHLHVRRTIGRGHRWTTSTNVVGWPDLLLWHRDQPGRHLAIELKVPPDRLTDDQAVVLASLETAGFECHVVAPDRGVNVTGLDDLPALLDKHRTRYRYTEAEWHRITPVRR